MAPPDISRDYSATREALAATLYRLISLSSFPLHFDTKFVHVPGVRFRSYCNPLCTKHSFGPKMAPKCDFVYKGSMQYWQVVLTL